jgi:V-type H+-transporting ATPase subunit a
MLLLMGLFSVYNGIIYNDFAGLSLNLFGSCYELQRETWHKVCTYQFGIDPVWQGQLSFVNSFKMKLSVIISYLHMGLGITMMAMNQRYNKNRLGIIAKFFPQILFLTCTFGYMDLLIVTKWNTIYQSKEQPPSIINSMISMILGFGEVEEGTELYRYQSAVQLFFVLIAIACVPWMWYPHIAAARHKI